MIDQSHIRNFSIIAHIDHGKSTLSDRLIELCDAVESARDGEPDPRQHGSRARARHHHQGARRQTDVYGARTARRIRSILIDTPGHVDFNYEVSRSLAACEGAVLVVDASQGVEAQTLANTYLALEHDLEILPVINKIDLPAADPRARQDRRSRTSSACPRWTRRRSPPRTASTSTPCSEDIVQNVPAPDGRCRTRRCKALIFDSQYDAYRGVIVLCPRHRGRDPQGHDHPHDGHGRGV